MSCITGSNPVKDGLVLSLDTHSRKSYIRAASTPLITMDAWTVSTGGISIYGQNGLTSENSRIYDTDPWGNQSIVWGTYASGDNGADGGWDCSHFSIDRTKLYRHSVWVRRTSATTAGTFYFGLHTNGTGDTYHLPDGASQTNPYWDYRNIGALTQNLWYLVVGHIFPNNHTGTTAHPNSGLYTIQDGKVGSLAGNVPSDVKFPVNATTMNNRVYHFYSGDATSRLQFYSPRVDLCDGTEPSMNELRYNGDSIWKDLSPYKNHGKLVSTPLYSNKALSFASNSASVPANSAFAFGTGDFTLECWIYPTSFSGYTHMLAFPDQTTLALKGAATTGEIYLYTSAWSTYGQIAGWNLTLNAWNHVVFVRSAAIGYGYKNSVLYGSKTGFTNSFTSQILNIHNGWLTEYTGCNISVVNVYNRALTAAEVKQNFNALRNRFGV